MSLREITRTCTLTYHQVTSCLAALRNKGYVKRTCTGIYEVTDKAVLHKQSPETQVKLLQSRIDYLEDQLKKLVTLGSLPITLLNDLVRSQDHKR